MVFEMAGLFYSKIMMFTGYVKEATSFREPLSKEEEKKMLLLARDGSKYAKDVLIEHNLRLVAHIVKKFQNCGEADDLISVGTIGLIKAINAYNIEKNASLSTYASRCIENEILMMLRSNKKHMKNISLESALKTDSDGNELTVYNTLEQEQEEIGDIVDKKIIFEQVKSLMKQYLNEREYTVIMMRFGLEGYRTHAQYEVAERLNISRSYISRIENKAISILKEKCQQKGLEL